MALDPSDKEPEGVTPYNKSGRTCPLWRKPCIKVCHNCELWQPLKLLVDGKEEKHWACSYNWTASMAARNVLATESVEAEAHIQNEQFSGFRGAVGQLVGQMAQANRLVEANKPPQKLIAEAEDAPEKSSDPAG